MTEIKDVTVLAKIDVDSDLSESALSDAMDKMKALHKDVSPSKTDLVVSSADAVMAGRLAEKFGFRVVQMPESVVRTDAWALVCDYYCVYSPGA